MDLQAYIKVNNKLSNKDTSSTTEQNFEYTC